MNEYTENDWRLLALELFGRAWENEQRRNPTRWEDPLTDTQLRMVREAWNETESPGNDDYLSYDCDLCGTTGTHRDGSYDSNDAWYCHDCGKES